VIYGVVTARPQRTRQPVLFAAAYRTAEAIALPEHELYSRETASLAEAYFRIARDRRRAILQLIRSMFEAPSG
jgi:hypothetical protein